MNKLIKYFKIIVFGFSLFLLFIVSIQKSDHPTILIYSLKNFVLLITLIFISSYLFISMFSKRLTEFNLSLSIGIISSAIILEACFWIDARIYPWHLIFYLGYPLRDKVIQAKGLNKKNDFEGNDLLYYYKPFKEVDLNIKDGLKSKIYIDELGFRNSKAYQEKVDIVLLGDSMILGTSSSLDLGELFRSKGFSVLNLGMGGYAPQHWVDSFKQFGIKTHPKYVFAFLFEGNDFFDAVNYQLSLDEKKSYEGYLNRTYQLFPKWNHSEFLPKPTLANTIISHSYVLSMSQGLILTPRVFIENYYKLNDYFYLKMIDQGSSDNNFLVLLNNKEFNIEFTHLTPNPGIINSDGFNLTIKAVLSLKNLCDKNGSELILLYLPTNSCVFAPYSEKHKFYADYQKVISNNIKEICEKENIIYLDVTPDLQKEIKHTMLYLDNGENTHFNEDGFKILSDIITSKIKLTKKLR